MTVALPIRIGLLTAMVLAVAIALVATLDALSFTRARTDAQKETISWSVRDLDSATESGLALGVPLANVAEAMLPRMKAALTQEPALIWITIWDRDAKVLASAGTGAPVVWPDEWMQRIEPRDMDKDADKDRTRGIILVSETKPTGVLAAPLLGVAEREGILAVGFDYRSSMADSEAFAYRLLMLSVVVWLISSLVVTLIIQWAARLHLSQLRHMQAALEGKGRSGDLDLELTFSRVRSAKAKAKP